MSGDWCELPAVQVFFGMTEWIEDRVNESPKHLGTLALNMVCHSTLSVIGVIMRPVIGAETRQVILDQRRERNRAWLRRPPFHLSWCLLLSCSSFLSSVLWKLLTVFPTSLSRVPFMIPTLVYNGINLE